MEDKFYFTHINDCSCVYFAEKINDNQYKVSWEHSIFGKGSEINHINFVKMSLEQGYWIKLKQGVVKMEDKFRFTHINDCSCVYLAEKINDNQYKVSWEHSILGKGSEINHINFIKTSLEQGHWIKC